VCADDGISAGVIAKGKACSSHKAFPAFGAIRLRLLTPYDIRLMVLYLRQAQEALAEITGEFSADELLGEIFSIFCIGK
jgi:tRNA U34 5-carboxymethylaminomethyl modifying GTPase MnmE/TrmE